LIFFRSPFIPGNTALRRLCPQNQPIEYPRRDGYLFQPAARPMKTSDLVLSAIRSAVAKNGRIPPSINEHTDLLVELDLDSLAMLEVVTTLEKELSIELIANLDIGAVNTPAKLAELADSLVARKAAK
jgi:acyl carrier protein